MIVVITELVKGRVMVSHGIDVKTDKVVILPELAPEQLGAKFDLDYNEWVLYD